MTAPSYTDLLAQKSALERQASELQRHIDQALKQERAGVIAKVKSMMVEHGLTISDLGTKGLKASAGAEPKRASPAPKYRDAATGNTWTGRGLKPRWLSAALAEGKSLADFAI